MARQHDLTLLTGLALVLTLCLAAALYISGLNGPPLLDDKSVLLPLMELDPSQWQSWFSEQVISNRGLLGRPVAMASFIFNAVNHGADIRYWNAINVLTHLAAGMLVFLLTRRLVDHVNYTAGIYSASWLAIFVTALWLLHPLQVSTVLYTVQRMAQLSGLFVLAGMLAYVAGRQHQIRNQAGGWFLIGMAFLLFFPLAVFSKENGLLFPLFIGLIEMIFFRLEGGPDIRRGLIAVHVVFLLLPVAAGLSMLVFMFDSLVLAGYVSRDFTLLERLLTEPRVLVFYLGLLVFPIQSNMGFYHDDFQISHGLVDPASTLFSIALLTGLLTLAWILRRKMPLVSFGLFFFFIAHLLESSLFPLQLVFEHRNYLASYGVLLALAAVLFRLVSKPRILSVMGLLFVVLLSFLTAARANTWGSYGVFHSFAYHAHPQSKALTTIFANTYADIGRYEEALQMLAKFDNVGFLVNRLYVMCQRDGYLDDGEVREVAAGLDGPVDQHAISSLFSLANAVLDDECILSSAAYQILLDRIFQLPISINHMRHLMMYRSHFYHREGQLNNAISTLENVFHLDTSLPVPLFLAVEWLIESGDLPRARAIYAKARVSASASRKNYSEYTSRIDAKLESIER